MGSALEKAGIESPRLCSEILLGHVLGVDRLKLYVDPDRPAGPEELAQLRGLVGRALKHEPVQYLTKTGWFFGLPLFVDQRVLVPRPCTEMIVERVLQQLRKRRVSLTQAALEGESNTDGGSATVSTPKLPPLRVLDVCTGSGAIAVALAKHGKGEIEVTATDISAEAIEVANLNAQRAGVADRIAFLLGDGLEPVRQAGLSGFDVIVSNPPYIPDHEWDAVPANVKQFEPALALRGGVDGLSIVRPLVVEAVELLNPGCEVMIEIASSTKAAVLELASRQSQLRDARVLDDLEGLPRLLVATRE
jgi:release factor glutamine methyltransferase